MSAAALKYYVYHRTTADQYTQVLDSKTRHMQLNAEIKKPDIIFIGNSRTEYQIDTKKIPNAYNYGVSGTSLPNYDFMSRQAIKIKPQAIIIGLSVEELYTDRLQIKRGLHLTDLLDVWQSNLKWQDKAEAFKTYMAGFNIIRIYADQIYERIKNFYKKFTPKNSSNTPKPDNTENYTPSNCKVISVDTLREDLTSYKCSHGDLLLHGIETSKREGNKKSLNIPNKEKIDYINTLLDRISRENIKPALLLEPSRNTTYSYDAAELKSMLHADIIDLSNLKTNNNMWGDTGHLNIEGRAYFSKEIFKEIKNIMR